VNLLTGIAAMKPAKRREELDRQLAAANSQTVELTYHPSAFDPPRSIPAKILGISEPLDGNSRDHMVVTPLVGELRLLTVGLHMIASIAPYAGRLVPTATILINGQAVEANVLQDPQAGDVDYDECGEESKHSGAFCNLPEYHGLVHIACSDDETGTFEYRVIEIWGHDQ
jgi:hypothetical protein